MKKDIWMENLESLAEAMHNRVIVDYNIFTLPYGDTSISFLTFKNKIFLKISEITEILGDGEPILFAALAKDHNVVLTSLPMFGENNIPAISLTDLEFLIVSELIEPKSSIDDQIIFQFSKWLQLHKDFLYLPAELVKEYVNHRSQQFRRYGESLKTFNSLERELERIESEYKIV